SLFRNISTAGALTSGSLGPRLDFDSSGNVLGLAVGDLDGDGRPDVLADNSYGLAVSMYRNVVPQNAGPPPPPCSSPSVGLVSWCRAEGNVADSADSNSGTLLDGATFTAGEIGQAFLFNTTNAGVKVPASANLDVGTGGGLTLEAWL